MNNLQKTGIALEGGGAKGAYQIGVLKAIIELNIQYDCVVGTSIGALNAAAYVLKDYENYYEGWRNFNFSLKDEAKKEQKSISFKLNEIIPNIKEFKNEYYDLKGVNPDNFIEILKKIIDEDGIRKSKIKYGLTTYCLTDEKPLNLFIENIPKGLLYEYIFASCNLPVFTPRLINGKNYIDGGVFNRLPINMLVELGYKNIITVRLRNDEYDFKAYDNINIIDIAPHEFLSSSLEATSERINWMLNKGYDDAINTLNKKKLL
ncbi:MAG: patatin-like phospholipase family protein [Tissierellia bacterium]|nr:patatin-like phospholipase family protein [Tissierellia bacterium]